MMSLPIPLALLSIKNEADKAFVEKLYLDYYPLMRKHAWQYIQDESLVEDMIQETIIRIIRNLEKLLVMECYVWPSYIVYTVRSVCIDYFRKNKSSRISFFDDICEGFENSLADEDKPEDSLLDSVSAEELSKRLAKLSKNDQFLLKAKYLLEYDDAAIAKLLGIKKDSVRVYLARARKRALQKLKE